MKEGFYMIENGKCPICNSEVLYTSNREASSFFYACPICGRFELSEPIEANINHIASYLIYNGFQSSSDEYRYHTFLDKETCDKYRKEFNEGNYTLGRPVHMDEEIIENWYPKTFSEKVDNILLFLNSRTKHVGQKTSFMAQELFSAFFIDRNEYQEPSMQDHGSWNKRNFEDCFNELKYMLNYLHKCSYIQFSYFTSGNDEGINIFLLPDGYTRIDALQKNTSRGYNALVAMKFGDDTIPLREAIRKGIKDANYNAIFIDEVQHNDFITPELLKYIRDSKFVVVDLTHQNNGAYFEEGYAMGLGKPVIQLCQEDTKLHFDIAQKNTIMWAVEDDIPEQLTNRINATID